MLRFKASGARAPKAAPMISLLTDFGTRDWFAGVLKGVIAQTCRSQVLDVTHEIPSGNVSAAAYVLRQSYACFPRGTVHLAVVDPGVGGPRMPIAIQTKNYYFVGPDNGLLSWAAARDGVRQIRRLANEKFRRRPASQTFHGRDIFAPAAAWLSRGEPIARLGPVAGSIIELPLPPLRPSRGGWEGRIVYIDHFGNAITNIPESHLQGLTRPMVRLKGFRATAILGFYEAVRPGKAVGVVGSTGCLEIAVSQGNAARAFDLKIGDAVEVCDGGAGQGSD